MNLRFNNKTQYNYSDNVKEIFTETFANEGSTDSPKIGKKLDSARRVFINSEGIIESIEFYHAGQIGLRSEFQFDGKSETKELLKSGTAGSIQKTIAHTHKNGNEFDYLVLDAGNRTAELGSKIIENNLIQSESFVAYGTNNYETSFQYDKEGRLIRTIRMMEKVDLIYDISYQYLKFDELRNWTERLIVNRNQEGKVTFSNLEQSSYQYY